MFTRKEIQARYREKNRVKLREASKIYTAQYRKDNFDKVKEDMKQYRLTHKEELSKKRKEYYQKNRKKEVTNVIIYINKRRKNDKIFKLRGDIHKIILKAFNRKRIPKGSTTEKILGCNFIQFKNHLEDNLYGFTILDADMDLDHIVPISTAKTKEDVEKLNHYSNFQLLPSYYNRHIKKDGVWEEVHFNKWFTKQIQGTSQVAFKPSELLEHP